MIVANYQTIWKVVDEPFPNRDERIIDISGFTRLTINAQWTAGRYESLALWILGSVEEQNPSRWCDMVDWCSFQGSKDALVTGTYRRRGLLAARLEDLNLRWIKLVLRKKWNRNHRSSIYVAFGGRG
jgi:hypothetical protein